MPKYESQALDLLDGGRKVTLKGSGFTGGDVEVYLLDADGRKLYEDTVRSRAVMINPTETVTLTMAKPETIWNITDGGKYALVWDVSQMADLQMNLMPVDTEGE